MPDTIIEFGANAAGLTNAIVPAVMPGKEVIDITESPTDSTFQPIQVAPGTVALRQGGEQSTVSGTPAALTSPANALPIMPILLAVAVYFFFIRGK